MRRLQLVRRRVSHQEWILKIEAQEITLITEVDVDSEHPAHDDAASEWGLSIIRQIACSPAKKKQA